MLVRRVRDLLVAASIASACALEGPPTITSFSPTTGPAGVTVTVFGTGLAGTSAAEIGGSSATIVSVSATRVVLRVPDSATTGSITLLTPGGPVTTRLRFVVAAARPFQAAAPRPAVIETTLGYSLLSVTTADGTFAVHLIKERLADLRVKTVTASDVECRRDCPVKPLDAYVRESGAFAAMNGTYLCPPDYADCAAKANSFDYAVYNTDIRRWVNLPALVTQNGLVTFTDGAPTFYRRAHVYSRARLSLAPITAGLSMYPLLLEDGEVVDSSTEQSDVQKVRSMKGSIASDGTHLFLALVAGVTVTESAHVLQTLGARDALNLDGGGTSAMWFDGSYRVGPGRLLPNAIVLTRR